MGAGSSREASFSGGGTTTAAVATPASGEAAGGGSAASGGVGAVDAAGGVGAGASGAMTGVGTLALDSHPDATTSTKISALTFDQSKAPRDLARRSDASFA